MWRKSDVDTALHDAEFSCKNCKSVDDAVVEFMGGRIVTRALIAIAVVAVAASGSPVLAKGCIKGAAVGAVGGHMVGKGHAVAGAAAGCAIGHHRAAKKAKAG